MVNIAPVRMHRVCPPRSVVRGASQGLIEDLDPLDDLRSDARVMPLPARNSRVNQLARARFVIMQAVDHSDGARLCPIT